MPLCTLDSLAETRGKGLLLIGVTGMTSRYAGLLAWCVAGSLSARAAAPGWTAAGSAWVWPGATLEIQVEASGALRITRAGSEVAALAFFQWHDQWVYERLERGAPSTPPSLDAQGVLHLKGLWGTTPPAAPLAYELDLTPTATGVEIALTVRKTADLKLTSGLWAVLSVPRRAPETRLLYAEPVGHAQVGQTLAGSFQRLLLGVPGEPALAVVPDEVGAVRSRIADRSHALEITLQPADFAVTESVTVKLALQETAMPTPPPDPAGPQRQAQAQRGIGPLPAEVRLYDSIDLAVDMVGAWDNPYDPDDVRLDALVTTANGTTYEIPGFYTVPHRRLVSRGMEIMMPETRGQWRVRLSANDVGPLRCELRARDRSGAVTFTVPLVQVIAAPARGFVRPSRVDPRYLVFDNGAPYLPIGHNLPIYPTAGQLVDEAITKMANAGENWNRWWLSSSGLGLEWEPTLGRYRQAQAARLDVALQLARERDFVYMLCLDTHQDFREGGWAANPFNLANGGPCKTAGDWFTDPTARRHYRNRLRYTVARWAASPQVLCWEFGNEFEGWADTPQEALLAWHREMATYLRSIDPYRHPITTSFWSSTGPQIFWQIPEIDIVQTHCYTNNDANVAEQVREYCLLQWRNSSKPHLFGEFGIRSHDTTADKDPKGWALHNAFWSAVASGCDGIPMPWWHENYIDPLNLYGHFTAIRRFTDGLPFGTAVWRQVETETAYADPQQTRPVRAAVLTPAEGFRRPTVNAFALAPDGSVNAPGELLALLHGEGHKDLRNPPVFSVTFPAPGTFTVSVDRVSNSGHLLISVDDVLVLDRELPCGEGQGKSWEFRPQWQLWESVYDEEIRVPVAAGLHRIRVENTGKDWVRVRSYGFEGCRVIDRPNLLVAALASERTAILWIQNRDSDWFNHGKGTVAAVPDAVVILKGLTDGPIEVEWWETWEGTRQRLEKAEVRAGTVALRVPALGTDVAARLRWPEK
jgi:hypothetical protein